MGHTLSPAPYLAPDSELLEKEAQAAATSSRAITECLERF